MKLVLTFASTLNGKITKGSDPDVTKWTSSEDQTHFKKILQEFDVVIRSSITYNLVKNKLNLNSNKRYIVLTREPEKYKAEAMPRKLEFTNESPKDLIARLEREGIKKALLAAGGNLVSAFFKEGLINEFQLTLEPKIFGTGTPMIADLEFETNLKLQSVEKLNENGSLLLIYKVE